MLKQIGRYPSQYELAAVLTRLKRHNSFYRSRLKDRIANAYLVRRRLRKTLCERGFIVRQDLRLTRGLRLRSLCFRDDRTNAVRF